MELLAHGDDHTPIGALNNLLLRNAVIWLFWATFPMSIENLGVTSGHCEKTTLPTCIIAIFLRKLLFSLGNVLGVLPDKHVKKSSVKN